MPDVDVIFDDDARALLKHLADAAWQSLKQASRFRESGSASPLLTFEGAAYLLSYPHC